MNQESTSRPHADAQGHRRWYGQSNRRAARIALAALLVTSLSGCGGTVTDNGPEPVPTDIGLSPEPVPTDIGLSPEPVPTDIGLSPEPVPTDVGLRPEPVPTDVGLMPEPVPLTES